MKLKDRVPTWLPGLMLLGLLLGGGYLGYQQVMARQRQATQQRIQTTTVERITAPVTISANGTVQPIMSVNVSPKTSGVLKELLVQEGDRVQQGQILAYMDASNLKGQLTQAQGQLASAQANLQRTISGNRPQEIGQAQAQVQNARANLQQAQLTYDRNTQLYKTGAIARQTLDLSRTAVETAQAQTRQTEQALSLQQSGSRPEDIEAAKADVTRAEGQLQVVQAQINDTVIRAPFSGFVSRKFADPGAFVTPTTSGSSVSSATSSSILSLASDNQVIAKVPEANIPKIKLGQTVRIEVDAYPNKTFTGKVTQIATQSTVEQNVTNFEVKMSVNDPQRLLRAGMNATVEFNVGSLDNAVVVPTVAIVRQEDGTGVYLADRGEPGKPRFQPITTGASVQNKTVVLSGLQPGDRVLLSFPPGERPASRTPSLIPGMGGPRGAGSSGGSRPGRSGG